MDKPNISRRETFRLARFGALLAVGLGAAENGTAGALQKGVLDTSIVKGDVGGVLIKWYGVNANGYDLLKTTSLKSVSQKTLVAGGVQFSLKLSKGGVTLTNISDVMQKI